MMKFSGKKSVNTNFKCTIRLLDDNEVLECEIQSFHKGNYLLDFVFNHLNLIETDYFGLRFADQYKQRHWLDSTKSILKQIKNMNPAIFCFRVKFYPADPLKLREEISRYFLFLQLRRDLLHGRLYCSQNDAATLGAYIIQADYGDADIENHSSSYISDYKILLKQTPKIEEKICEVHKTLLGLSPSLAELYFLKKASSLDTYGVDPYSVKDHRGIHLYLGLSHAGVFTFQGSKRTHHFRWSEVDKLNYEGKMFIVHLLFLEDARTKRKHTVGFKCSSASACRNLWRSAVEQRLFYSMDCSNKHGMVVTGGSFFSRGSRFRYQGRCEKEVIEDSAGIVRNPPSVKRISLKTMGRSVSLPTTPADSDNYESVMSRVHRPLPYIDRSTSLDEEVLCGTDTLTSSHDIFTNGSFPGEGAYCPESTLPPLNQLEPLTEDSEKFNESAILDMETDVRKKMDYYEQQAKPYSPISGPKQNQNTRSISDPKKRLFRLPNVTDDEYFPTQLLCNCEESKSPYDREDTSSTSADTLDSPTEPLDVPLPTNQNVSFSKERKDRAAGNQGTVTTSNGGTPKAPSGTLSLRQRPVTVKMAPISSLVANLFTFSRVFLVTFVFVVLTLSLCILFIFETDFANLDAIKGTREMVLLRVQYYEPIKYYIIQFFSRK